MEANSFVGPFEFAKVGKTFREPNHIPNKVWDDLQEFSTIIYVEGVDNIDPIACPLELIVSGRTTATTMTQQ